MITSRLATVVRVRRDGLPGGPPGWRPWSECVGTGYLADRPAWLTTWLMIVVDNTMHVVINGAALRWLT